MTPEELVARVLAFVDFGPALGWQLTLKERDVAALLLTGLPIRRIAAACGVTEKTMKHHARAIYHKYDVATRLELIARFTGMDDYPMPPVDRGRAPGTKNVVPARVHREMGSAR